ncbi:cGMP-dependent protein kinase [Durusdinium trenchii]|uniref:cGMP-dependent protein kinase n=1 Tax=Durusdinium trenchii TaxID=1381693 RepID=A0ABP0HST4_9DINO
MGTTFFVTHTGTLEVSVNGNVVNTLMEGQAFGGLALLYNCPRTATVKALIDAGVWGANGHNFKQVLAQNAANRQADNLKFLDSIKVFDGLNQKQKDQIALSALSEWFDAGQRVATQGETLAAIYFVKKGGLKVMTGGEVKADGKFSGGNEEHHLSSGEYIGAALLLSAKTRPMWENTLLADAKTELLCISVKDLKEILGNNLAKILETALVNKGLRMCPVMSQFSSTQRNDIAKAIAPRVRNENGRIEAGVRYIVVLEGSVTGMHKEEEAPQSALHAGRRQEWLAIDEVTNADRLARVKSSPLPHAVGEEALPAVARSNSEGSAARVRAAATRAAVAALALALPSLAARGEICLQPCDSLIQCSFIECCAPTHVVCVHCLRRYLQGQIEERRVAIHCPLYGREGCTAQVRVEDLQVLPEATLQKYQRFKAMEEDPTLRECPECQELVKPTLAFAEDLESEVGNIDPAMCCSQGHQFCYYHSNAHAQGSEACEAYGLREAAEAREALRSQGAKECPQCRWDAEWTGAGSVEAAEGGLEVGGQNPDPEARRLQPHGLHRLSMPLVLDVRQGCGRSPELGLALQSSESHGLYAVFRLGEEPFEVHPAGAGHCFAGRLAGIRDLLEHPATVAGVWARGPAVGAAVALRGLRLVLHHRSLCLRLMLLWDDRCSGRAHPLCPLPLVLGLCGVFAGWLGARALRERHASEARTKHPPELRQSGDVTPVLTAARWARTVTLERAQWLEDGGLLESESSAEAKSEIRRVHDGEGNGARVGFLTKEGLLSALKELGLAAIGNAEEAGAVRTRRATVGAELSEEHGKLSEQLEIASDLTRKLIVAKKVHIFRHLSSEQITKLVIASGDVKVEINGKFIRTMTKNSYFGERALLFDEPRTATVEVSSPEAELWSIEKSTFSSIVKGKMQQELMHRIRLQDTDFTMKDCQIGLMGLESGTPFPQDLKTVRVIGAGAAGVVRLVMNKKTGAVALSRCRVRYALKRVRKNQGKIPVEVKRECELLKAQEHPFIMRLVQTFETHKSVYILTELITGGELHGAIREIPTVLSRAQAQFYTGCLIIVLEELSEKNIVYRDLKPENVMLDAQGYLKLIDFGIAKKLEEGKTRTFTMIGTPHYMAPEIMRGHGYGTEVDLWSLGIILFEFVCGYLPFADELDDPTEVCTAVLKDPLELPDGRPLCRRTSDAVRPDAQCKAVIQGMLNRQPKKRLGAGGMNGWEDIRTAECWPGPGFQWNSEFFLIGHSGSTLFDKIMGRELEAPVMPKAGAERRGGRAWETMKHILRPSTDRGNAKPTASSIVMPSQELCQRCKGEKYCEPTDIDFTLSDEGELG